MSHLWSFLCLLSLEKVWNYFSLDRADFAVKKLINFSHLRSFLWLRSCLLSFEEVRKDHWHPGWTQTYGLTPVWTRSWAISLDWILNSLSQVEHCKRAFSIALKLDMFLIIVNYSFWKNKSSLRWESCFEIFYSITKAKLLLLKLIHLFVREVLLVKSWKSKKLRPPSIQLLKLM